MKFPVLIGLIGGAIIGSLQFYSMILSMEDGPQGTFQMLLYYSPQIFYFMCIYMSVKIYTRVQTEAIPSFKGCLKAGGVTAVLIALIWGIAFCVALTHINVEKDMRAMIDAGQGNMVKQFLSSVTMQVMFDRAKFWSMPNFLLGFVMTVLVTVIFRMRGKKTA